MRDWRVMTSAGVEVEPGTPTVAETAGEVSPAPDPEAPEPADGSGLGNGRPDGSGGAGAGLGTGVGTRGGHRCSGAGGGPSTRRAAALWPGLRSAWVALPAVLAALPFVAMLVALVADHPAITPYGDRAVTALAVRDLLGGHQLLGAYSRYGWHHPGPAFFLPLATAHLLTGGAHWALDAGMLITVAASAALVVVVVLRAAGPRAALAVAGALGLYVHAVGPATFRDPWNPWGLLVPLVLLTVLGAAAGTGSAASLACAVLVTSWLVQTHVGAAPVSLAVLVAAAALAWRSRRHDAAPRARSPWRQPAVWVPLAAAVVLWLPPLVQEATGSDPNLSELWRFFVDRHPGHSLATAVSAVGDRLGFLPFGTHHALVTTHSAARWDQAGVGAAVLAGYLLAGGVLAVIGHRRGDAFARSLGVLTVVAIVTAVAAVRSIQGPLNGFLVAWVTAIPLGAWAAVASLLSRQPLAEGWATALRRHPTRAGGSREVLGLALAVVVAGALAMAGTAASTAAALTAPSAQVESAPSVTRAWRQLRPHLVDREPRAVLLRVTDPYGWPVQAGLALAIEEHGWQAHVEDDWVFMFGASRRVTGTEPVVATLRAVSPQGPAERLTVEVTTTLPPAPPGALTTAMQQVATVLGSSLAPPAARPLTPGLSPAPPAGPTAPSPAVSPASQPPARGP